MERYVISLRWLVPDLLVPRYAIFEADPLATKNVQRASDCQVDTTIAQGFDSFKIIQGLPASSISHWDSTPLAKSLDQVFVDTALQALIICGMNKKL